MGDARPPPFPKALRCPRSARHSKLLDIDELADPTAHHHQGARTTHAGPQTRAEPICRGVRPLRVGGVSGEHHRAPAALSWTLLGPAASKPSAVFLERARA